MSKAVSATKQVIAFICFLLGAILDPISTMHRSLIGKKSRQ